MRKIDRFLQYLDYKGISANKATVDCGLSNGLIGQAKKGKSDLGDKAIDKITNFYQDLNRVWLLTGSGSMLNGQNYIGGDGVIGSENNVTFADQHAKIFEKDLEIARLQAIIECKDDQIAMLKELINRK